MARYTFKCATCNEVAEVTASVTEDYQVPHCSVHGAMVRNFRADLPVAAVANLKRERDMGGSRAMRDLFLPTARDFQSPTDPDGQRGLRDWAESHAPREGNAKPLWPEMQKQVF